MKNPAPLAKLVRPSASRLVPRQRLFSQLDTAAREGRVAWVCGPAGAGKSSLVVSWSASVQRECAWYQLDARDGDPASFFHYLKLLAQTSARDEGPELPHLTPEYVLGLEAFAQRFFEAFYATLREPFTVVLDNLHEIPPQESLDTLLQAAIRALPPQGLLVIVSRSEPGAGLARCRADPGFHFIGQEALTLDDEEAWLLASTMGARDEAGVLALNRRVRGWAAGLVLMLRARSTGVDLPGDTQPQASPQVLFDYIATEIFGKTPGPMRDLLLRTAPLPHVDAEAAQELTGDPGAGRHLEWLEQRRLLTTRRPGALDTYEYHPLFREFLLQRAGSELGAQEWKRVRRQAASLLAGAGQFEPAASLWIETAAWPELAELVHRQAGTLIAQGRAALLESWLDALPQPERASSPWLLYWEGISRSLRNPALGRPALEAAYWSFKAAADRAGTVLALAGILSGYFLQWGDLRPVDAWIGELDALLDTCQGALSLEEEARVLESCLVVLMRDPGYARMPALLRRATELIEGVQDPTLRLRLAPLVNVARIWYGDYTAAQVLCDELLRQQDVPVPVFARLFAATFIGCVFWQQAEHQRAHEVLRAGLRLAKECGIRVLDSMLAVHEAYTSLSECDPDSAEAMLDFGEAWVHPSRQMDVLVYRFMRAGVLLHRGELERALAIAADNLPRAAELGSPFGEATFRIQLGQLLMLTGRHAQAQDQFRSVSARWRSAGSDILCFQAGMGLAWSLMQEGHEQEGLQQLREALRIGARRDYMNCHPWWLPRVMSDLCARALSADIESPYVRRLVAKRRLEPPASIAYAADWPWAVRVRSLGGFGLEVQDRPVHPASKAQKKPLELLKAVLAHGPEGASHGILADQLWPELDGDAARNALHSTLHRLRRLVGEEHAVLVQEGRVALDPRRVWSDTAALARIVDEVHQLDPARARSDGESAVRVASRLCESLLSLYRGEFLASEELPDWAVAARARTHSRFMRACGVLGQVLEAGGAHAQACTLYARVLELDPAAEEFHRGVIRSLAAQGRVSEAVDSYHRCRTLLGRMLGVAPSAATEALFRSLR